MKEYQFKTFCPYRVAPIGAHSDIQFGKISGFALDKGITVKYNVIPDGRFTLRSANFNGEVRFSADKIPEHKQGDWADYLRGAVHVLSRTRTVENGIDAYIEGTLPIGGLSSSAAVTIAFISAVIKANGIILTSEELIDTALKAENEYVGVKCGRMDQSCEVYAKKDCLLFVDTFDGTHETIAPGAGMKPYEIAVFFSGVPRTLVGSAYNMRVDEIQSAAYALLAFSGMPYGNFADKRLRQIPVEVFNEYKNKLPDNWRKRAEHWYSEQERVEKGISAWRKGDIETFGKLSFESGHSSIYSYETGSPELKKLYDIMLNTDGIYGGRFSGAGFKGCCVALIDPEFKDSITEKITREYLKEFPALSDTFGVYYCKSSDGVGR